MRSVHALHKHRFLMLSAMCILIVFLTACNAYVWSTTPRSMECNEKARNGSEVFIRDAPADEHPRIIVWTKYFGSERQLPNLQNGGSCLKHCVLTSERTDYENATAILFHWNDLDPYDLPARRDWRQRYVYENLESPLNTARKYDNIHNSWALNFFNWTMTYRSDSDIYAPYDRLLPKSAPPLPGHEYHAYNWSEVRDAISKKDKLAFQLVSNCYSRSGREAIVNELQKHIEVSVRGQCSNFVCDTACEKEMLERHKFYLAFENSICDEYVSEKVWRMKQLIVPVVLRASDYSTLLPNGSFLAVDQFPSLYQLALQLLDLASNNSEYERFFEWTKEYQYTTINFNYKFCELCENLYADTSTKVYADIQEWWQGDLSGGHCVQQAAPFRTWIIWTTVCILLFIILAIPSVLRYIDYLRRFRRTKGHLARKYNAVAPERTTQNGKSSTKQQ